MNIKIDWAMLQEAYIASYIFAIQNIVSVL